MQSQKLGEGKWCSIPPSAPAYPCSSLCSDSVNKTSPKVAPMASREKIRSRFHGSHDLIHRLFVCISGGARIEGRPGFAQGAVG